MAPSSDFERQSQDGLPPGPLLTSAGEPYRHLWLPIGDETDVIVAESNMGPGSTRGPHLSKSGSRYLLDPGEPQWVSKVDLITCAWTLNSLREGAAPVNEDELIMMWWVVRFWQPLVSYFRHATRLVDKYERSLRDRIRSDIAGLVSQVHYQFILKEEHRLLIRCDALGGS